MNVEVNGKNRIGMPLGQHPQQQNASSHTQRPTAHRNQNRLGEQLPHDSAAAGAKRQAHRDFARPIRGASGEQAAEVRARGKQDQSRKQHEPGYKGVHRTPEHVSRKTGTRQLKDHAVIFLGIGRGQIGRDAVQVGRGLRWSHAARQTPNHPPPAIAARIQTA